MSEQPTMITNIDHIDENTKACQINLGRYATGKSCKECGLACISKNLNPDEGRTTWGHENNYNTPFGFLSGYLKFNGNVELVEFYKHDKKCPIYRRIRTAITHARNCSKNGRRISRGEGTCVVCRTTHTRNYIIDEITCEKGNGMCWDCLDLTSKDDKVIAMLENPPKPKSFHRVSRHSPLDFYGEHVSIEVSSDESDDIRCAQRLGACIRSMEEGALKRMEEDLEDMRQRISEAKALRDKWMVAGGSKN